MIATQRHPTASAYAAARLRDAILAGDLKSGERLQQHALAARFGLSHVPLREALQRLEGEGFVAIHPRRGAFVMSLNRADAMEIFELRALLEPQALAHAMPRLTPSAIEDARNLCADADRVTDVIAYGELNERLHRLLYAAGNRPRLLALIETLWRNAARYAMVLRHQGTHFAQSQAEHRLLIDAVAEGEAETAKEILRNHINAAAEKIVAQLHD